MRVYKELYQVISDYVGYSDDCVCIDCNNDVPTNAPDECADPILFDNIVDECTRHIRGMTPIDKLSSDAQYCMKQWEEVMESINQYNFNFETGGIDGPRPRDN